MVFTRQTFCRIAGAALLAAGLVGNLAAQGYPHRPIQLIVGFAPGGSTDLAARIFAQRLSAKLGQPVVVQGRPGGAGVLAADIVAKAPPDGYQLLVIATGTATNLALRTKAGVDLDKDLAPISLATEMPLVLVMPTSAPPNSVKEVIELARAQPGKLTFGSDGVGGASHLAGELFNKLAKVDTFHVPYKGGGESVIATSAGQVDMNFPTVTSALAMIQAGKLKPLAVSGSRRSPQLPNVPTFDELGIPGFELTSFVGLMGPRGMPKDVTDKLQAAMVDAAADAEVKAASAKQGMEAIANTPEQFGQYLRRYHDLVVRLGQDSNIKLD